MGSAAVSGKLYVVGGSSGQSALDTVECFDPTLGRWGLVHPMPTARQRCAAATLGGQLLVVGGECIGPLSIVEGFDPVLQIWKQFPSMMMERTGCAAATVLGRLYVAGGADKEWHASATAEC